MGLEDFTQLARLFKQVHAAPGPDGWTPEARLAVTARFDRLLAVWLDDPLTEAGFRRTANRWVLGRGSVRPFVEVQRRKRFEFDGLVQFTINWGIWVEAFAQQVGGAKKPSPSMSTAPFAARIGHVLPAADDVWWIAATNGVIRMATPPRLEPEPPAPDDEVALVVRDELVPMLVPITTVRAAISAIEQWSSQGIPPSRIYMTMDPLVSLRRFIEPAESSHRTRSVGRD